MKTRARCWKSPSLLETLTTYARSLPKEITDIFKKKTKDFGYGLLLTETGIKLLIMKTSPKCRTIKLAWIGRLTGECLPKEIGDRSKWTYFKLYTRIKNKYKVNYLCTDGYEAYSSFTLAEKKHTTTKAEIRSPSYASLLAITNLLLDEARSPTMMCLHNHCSLSLGKVPKRLKGARSMRWVYEVNEYQTSLIESTNFLIRHYLARFQRKQGLDVEKRVYQGYMLA